MGYSSAQAKSFVSLIAPLIQNEAKKRGYKICSTIIAQAIIEGAAGTSVLAAKYHNHFGMKCGKHWTGASVNMSTKEEYTAGTLTTIKDNFRAYPSDQEGVKGYFDFVSTSRYANLKTAADYRQYAQYLKSDGYATSSTYVNTLISTVQKYDLTQYDAISAEADIVSMLPTLRIGDSGEYVKKLQSLLTHHGFVTTTDGIFGTNTKKSLLAYQSAAGLAADGICGKKTWTKLLE